MGTGVYMTELPFSLPFSAHLAGTGQGFLSHVDKKGKQNLVLRSPESGSQISQCALGSRLELDPGVCVFPEMCYPVAFLRQRAWGHEVPAPKGGRHGGSPSCLFSLSPRTHSLWSSPTSRRTPHPTIGATISLCLASVRCATPATRTWRSRLSEYKAGVSVGPQSSQPGLRV